MTKEEQALQLVETITAKEAHQRKVELMNAMCVLKYGESYYDSNYMWVRDRTRAVCSRLEVMIQYTSPTSPCLYEILGRPVPKVPPCPKCTAKERKWRLKPEPGFYCGCGFYEQVKMRSIGDVVREDIIKMLKATPTNPTVRAIICDNLRVPIPKNLKTYEAIEHWIEYESNPTPPKPAPPDLIIKCRASEVEYGRAEYSVTTTGNYETILSYDNLATLLQECETWDDVVAGISEQCSLIGEDAHMEPDLGTQEIHDREANNHDDWDWSPLNGMSAHKALLKAYIKQHFPQLAQQFNAAEDEDEES